MASSKRIMVINIFSKMKAAIRDRVINHRSGLYLYLAFPIAVSFLLTFTGARIFSYFAPNIWISWFDIHVHHYLYGFYILLISGYLALVFDGPRGKYLIALLHGFGAGLAFDEYGMWLRLDASDPSRWSYDGFLIIIGSFLALISAKRGIIMFRNHLWPSKHQTDPTQTINPPFNPPPNL